MQALPVKSEAKEALSTSAFSILSVTRLSCPSVDGCTFSLLYDTFILLKFFPVMLYFYC